MLYEVITGRTTSRDRFGRLRPRGILEADGVDLAARSVVEAQKLIKGPIGTEVVLTVRPVDAIRTWQMGLAP